MSVRFLPLNRKKEGGITFNERRFADLCYQGGYSLQKSKYSFKIRKLVKS
jgi:hypothetical protein